MNTVLAPDAPWPYPRTPPPPRKQMIKNHEALIVGYIREHPGCSIYDIAPAVDLVPMTVNRKLRPIRAKGHVYGKFIGANNQGFRYWAV